MSALGAMTRVELALTLRRGESVLLTLLIPVGLLAFFSTVAVLPEPAGGVSRVASLTPRVLALAVLSAAFVGPAIATGFERGYGVLARLGYTPLGRPRLLGAKTAAVLVVEVLQVLAIVATAAVLGWRPSLDAAGLAAAVAAVLLATVAFAGFALVLAGTLRPEVNLAAANGLYLVLLLAGGLLVPVDDLPGGLATVASWLPPGALAAVLGDALGVPGEPVTAATWAVLVGWAVVAPLLAARTFRWDP